MRAIAIFLFLFGVALIYLSYAVAYEQGNVSPIFVGMLLGAIVFAVVKRRHL